MERPADPGTEPQNTIDRILVMNPATRMPVGTIHRGSAGDVDSAVIRAGAALSGFAKKDPVDRGKILSTAAGMVRTGQEDLARLLTAEQGKPLKESRNEIAGFARILEYYASISGQMRGDYGHSTTYGHAIVQRHPIGICGAIIPWNVPGIIMGWKVGPALAAGNAVILKPASSAPLTCIQLAGLLHKSGIPEDILQVVTGQGEIVGEAMAAHPDIRSISFTGEVKTGRRVAELAAPTFKRTTLELGGSDPMIVCSDADLTDAARGAVAGRFYNCGQTCTAVKRLFVDATIAQDFIRKLELLISSLSVGNGLLSGTDMGPIHSESQRTLVEEQVEKTLEGGYGILKYGGSAPSSGDLTDGYFYQPTLLTDLVPDAPVLREEVFGPVLPVMTYDTLDDAFLGANNTRFGLGASIWTHDMRIATRACEELQAGIIWVNQHLKIPPEVPFGGCKDSGIGRENGRYAIEHYLEEKTILVKP
ncbi:MAG TPA: aldehyde dehydrogenase family protein [Methanospirillum sp.]|nr:aldehyde dehydrogenase family protein [Methanospirillum sp.]